MDIELQNQPSTSSEPPPPYDVVRGTRVDLISIDSSASCTIRKRSNLIPLSFVSNLTHAWLQW